MNEDEKKLRDEFAKVALQSLIAHPYRVGYSIESYARDAWRFANAMMKYRDSDESAAEGNGTQG